MSSEQQEEIKVVIIELNDVNLQEEELEDGRYFDVGYGYYKERY